MGGRGRRRRRRVSGARQHSARWPSGHSCRAQGLANRHSSLARRLRATSQSLLPQTGSGSCSRSRPLVCPRAGRLRWWRELVGSDGRSTAGEAAAADVPMMSGVERQRKLKRKPESKGMRKATRHCGRQKEVNTSKSCRSPPSSPTVHHRMTRRPSRHPLVILNGRLRSSACGWRALASAVRCISEELIEGCSPSSTAAQRRADVDAFTTPVLKFWRTHCSRLPTWAKAACIIFTLSPNSALCEHVFSLLACTFTREH